MASKASSQDMITAQGECVPFSTAEMVAMNAYIICGHVRNWYERKWDVQDVKYL